MAIPMIRLDRKFAGRYFGLRPRLSLDVFTHYPGDTVIAREVEAAATKELIEELGNQMALVFSRRLLVSVKHHEFEPVVDLGSSLRESCALARRQGDEAEKKEADA